MAEVEYISLSTAKNLAENLASSNKDLKLTESQRESLVTVLQDHRVPNLLSDAAEASKQSLIDLRELIKYQEIPENSASIFNYDPRGKLHSVSFIKVGELKIDGNGNSTRTNDESIGSISNGPKFIALKNSVDAKEAANDALLGEISSRVGDATTKQDMRAVTSALYELLHDGKLEKYIEKPAAVEKDSGPLGLLDGVNPKDLPKLAFADAGPGGADTGQLSSGAAGGRASPIQLA